jgi:hypothetical protein
MEPATIAAALGAANHVTTLAKNLANTIKASGKSELLGEFIELQSAMMDLQQKQHDLVNRIRELEEENLALKNESDLRSKMHFKGHWYEIRGAGKQDGLYCSVCFDSTRKLVRLLIYQKPRGDIGYKCNVCHGNF